jgi:transcriptional regulator with XRE-family HTH domain
MAQRSTAIAVLPEPFPQPGGTTRLKIEITKRGYTQKMIARRLRMLPSKLNRIVLGRVEASDDEQDRLAELLQVPRGVLFRAIAR